MTELPLDPTHEGVRVLAAHPPTRPVTEWVDPAGRAPTGTPSLMQIAAQNRARMIEERSARARVLLWLTAPGP